ncbi:hypothetical protein EG68_00047 [Paragonimus skrjabini miyazakii]|uniref:Uncharacterized protein n=1 Tax=Paragonimus skrjabini miyazakii TaxID=59628 RepID=A0A8S9ZCX3_9TREM|nr:hypothetical protein EG68_00047 [Paragonimus skrjabini miyazakii]
MMSDDASYEKLSISSSDSWDLLDAERNLLNRDGWNNELCALCGLNRGNANFRHVTCDQCIVCASCNDKLNAFGDIPPCTHLNDYEHLDESLFVFEDPASQKDGMLACRHDSPAKAPTPVPCVPDSEAVDLSEQAINLSSQVENHTETNVASPYVNKPTTHRSLVDNVIEALQLSPPLPTETTDQFQQVPFPLPANGSMLGSQRCLRYSPTGPAPLEASANVRFWPVLPSQSNRSSVSSDHSSVPPMLKPSLFIPSSSVQMTTIKCSSSECHTSSSSSPSPPSPQSLSSSPLNAATKFLKSMVLHSAATLNTFDLAPLDPLDKPLSTNITTAAATSLAVQSHSGNSTITPSPMIGDEDAPTCLDMFGSRHRVWDQSQLRRLVQPKPIPKTVSEASAYNLR